MMKKSKIVSLVLITAALSSCNKNAEEDGDWGGDKKVYIRSDSTASYSHHHGGAWIWYYAFRPYGYYSGGFYHRAGYYSGGIGHSANVGSNAAKGRVSRGGFGRSGARSVWS
jgi:hypothetical protein